MFHVKHPCHPPPIATKPFSRDFLFDFPIPTRLVARTAFLCKALADFVPQCPQVVAEVAGFASGGPSTAADPFPASIPATLLPAFPVSSSRFAPLGVSLYPAGDG